MNKAKNRSVTAGLSRRVLMGAIFWTVLLNGLPLFAQKVIVLTNADIGKVITSTHHYSNAEQVFRLSLKHRLSGIQAVQISLQKEIQFGKTPFDLKQQLPVTLNPDESIDLEFEVNYNRGVQMENTISLLVAPVGDPDPRTRGIGVNIKLSADGRLMFWNERNQQYTKTLPNFEFTGPGEKLIEISWNGGGPNTCTFNIETSGRDAFQLIPHQPGAAPLANGSTFSVAGNGGTAFIIQYDGAARRNIADLARITFTEPSGQSLQANLIGAYEGGNSLFISGRDFLSRGKILGDFTGAAPVNDGGGKQITVMAIGGKDQIKNSGKDAVDGLNHNVPSITGSDDPLVERGKTNSNSGNSNSGIVPTRKTNAVNITGSGGGMSEEDAKARLLQYYNRHKDEDLIQVKQAKFERVEGIFEAKVPFTIDSLFADPNFNITPIWVKLHSSTDSVTLPNTNYTVIPDSTILRIKLSSEAEEKIAKEDSFRVEVGFMPDYLAGGIAQTLGNEEQVFRGSTYGKTYSNNNWLIFLWAIIASVVFLFFFIGFLVARQPITAFRYLRESRYQRERHKANNERNRVEVETVHIDLARHDTDLVQLSFVDKGEMLDGRADGGIEKVRTIMATVPTPRRGGLKRFFVWLYAPFGRKREPRFRSVYYSLRIELPKGAVPQHLRLKDEGGMLMLGTSLTGNVLATDHQDFKFTQRPFHFSLYVDPAEFMDYSGAMKTVSIPFRVIEEPFEGYVMTREFNLNLEIQQRM